MDLPCFWCVKFKLQGGPTFICVACARRRTPFSFYALAPWRHDFMNWNDFYDDLFNLGIWWMHSFSILVWPCFKDANPMKINCRGLIDLASILVLAINLLGSRKGLPSNWKKKKDWSWTTSLKHTSEVKHKQLASTIFTFWHQQLEKLVCLDQS